MNRYVVALYIRLSIEDSKVESLSVQNQRLALRRYVDCMEDVSHVEVMEFIDNGHSGVTFERPAIQELLDMVRAGQIHCIIVKDFSRFGRNRLEVGYFIERVFPLFGIRFISISDDFDSKKLDGDTGGSETAYRYIISEFYSYDLSQKSKTSKYIKMKAGEYQSALCPYGYQKSADGRMEIDEETAPNVRLIFELAKTAANAQDIVKALYERGIPTPGEHKAAKGMKHHDVSRCCRLWQRSTILRMLTDERYAGTYIIGKRKVLEVGGSHVRTKPESEWFKIPSHHPAIVEMEVFQRIREKFTYAKCHKTAVKQYPLRGKVFCGSCRHAMPRTGKYPVFSCRYMKADPQADCHDLRIKESELETAVYQVISKQAEIVLNIKDISDLGELNELLSKQSVYQKQIQELTKQKLRLYENFLRKALDESAYTQAKAPYDTELDRLKHLHSLVAAKAAQMKSGSEAQSANHKLATEIVGAGGLTAALTDALIDRVYVYPGNRLEITWKMNDFWGGTGHE